MTPADGAAVSGILGRRRFLQRALGRRRSITISCGHLYVRFVNAVAAGRLADFTAALEYEIRAAATIHLTEREWLARDDFRNLLDQALTKHRRRG
jgi:hypothetical protein